MQFQSVDLKILYRLYNKAQKPHGLEMPNGISV